MKLSKAIKDYLRYHKLRESTPKTIKNYREVLTRFMNFTGDIEVEDLTLDIILDYQETLVDRKLSKATVANYLRHIKAFINYLEQNNVIESETLAKRIKMPSKSKRIVEVFGQNDVLAIFDAIERKPAWIYYRNCLIIALMYDSGLRQEEVSKVSKEDIILEQDILKVHGKGDKERFVPLGNMTKHFIQEYLLLCPFKTKYLLCNRDGSQITTNTIKLFVNRLKKRTGLKHLSSHKLRHNFATNYCIDMYKEHGYVDIYKLSALLGHEEVETTKIYLHIAEKYIATSNFKSHLDAII